METLHSNKKAQRQETLGKLTLFGGTFIEIFGAGVSFLNEQPLVAIGLAIIATGTALLGIHLIHPAGNRRP